MKRRLPLILLSFAVLFSFYIQYHFSSLHVTPTGDEGHYIDLADNILKGRGYVSRVKHHFYPFNDSVEHPDDTRQPLVPYLFAALFYFTGVSYEASKGLLICFNLLNLILVYIIGKTVFDEKIAVVTVTIVGLYPSQIFPWTGITQSSEPIFTFLFLLTVYLTILAKKKQLWWLVIGVLCGLLYLTRANGLWLLLPLALHMYFVKDELNFKKILLVTVSFITVCLPWFIRNYRLFGNPIYTSAQHIYWLDSFWSFQAYIDYVPSFSHYMKTHSAMQILARCWSGLYSTLRAFLLVIWGFSVFLPFFLYSLLHHGQYRRFSFFYLSILVTVLGLLWYAPAFPVPRFLVPFHPLIILWSIGGIFQCGKVLGPRAPDKPSSIFSRKNVFVAATLAILFFTPVKVILDNYKPNDRNKVHHLNQISDWIQKNTSENDIIMVESTDDLHQLVFKYNRKTVFIPNNNFETIFKIARKYKVNYIMISKKLLRYFEKGFYKFWIYTPQGIKERYPLSYLSLVYKQSDGLYLIYRIM